MSGTPYDDALAYWYGRINFEQRSPRPGDLKLHTMRCLLSRLGSPQDRLRLIHVTGSKGKGSVSAFLASILRRAGYRTGLFSSPHLVDVRERVQIDGQAISRDELTQLIADVRRVIERPPALEATFFEVATAVGFLHFVRRRVETAVIEVGLGGRYDSTNVCRPAVSVIASISFDHTRQLGNTLARIAREKAGILKAGIPGISGATGEEARAVIEEVARQKKVPLRQLGREIRYRYEPGAVTATEWRPPRVRVRTDLREWPWLELGLLGEHQAANAALVVACVEAMRRQGWELTDRAVAEGLHQVEWPARMEVVGRGPLAVLDCAHNVASAEALVETLRSSFPGFTGRRFLVFAGSNDKDLPGMLRVLAPHFDRAFLTCHDNAPRQVPLPQLEALIAAHASLSWESHPDAVVAWRAAQAQAAEGDLICATGSVYLAGQIRPLLVAPQVER